MSPSPRTASSQSSAQKRRLGHAQAVPLADDEMGSFDLKDTLNGISVRDTSFSEFLAALKHYGKHTSTV